jgi:hypothetical protein
MFSLYALLVILVTSWIAALASRGYVGGELILPITCFHIGVFLVLWSGLALLRHFGLSLLVASDESKSLPLEHSTQTGEDGENTRGTETRSSGDAD